MVVGVEDEGADGVEDKVGEEVDGSLGRQAL